MIWGHRFELGGSIVAASMFVCLLLMGPARSLALSTPIHAVTGLWNLEDLLAHLVYLAGLIALFHTLVYRTTLDEPERFLRRCLEMPTVVILPMLVALFIVGTPKEHYPDLFRAPETGWMNLYWAVCARRRAIFWLTCCGCCGWCAAIPAPPSPPTSILLPSASTPRDSRLFWFRG